MYVGLYVCVACISVSMCALVLANRKHFTRSKAAYALRASTSSTTVQVSPLLASGRNPITLLLRLSSFPPLRSFLQLSAVFEKHLPPLYVVVQWFISKIETKASPWATPLRKGPLGAPFDQCTGSGGKWCRVGPSALMNKVFYSLRGDKSHGRMPSFPLSLSLSDTDECI